MRELFMCTRHWHPSSYQSSDPRALFREACTVTVGSSTCIWTQRKTNEIPTWRGISLVNQTVLIHWGIYSYSGLSDLLELKKQRSWLLSDYAKALLVHNRHLFTCMSMGIEELWIAYWPMSFTSLRCFYQCRTCEFITSELCVVLKYPYQVKYHSITKWNLVRSLANLKSRSYANLWMCM